MILKIVKFPHPALLRASQPVVEFNEALRVLAQNMLDTMAASDGIGLAANQVGVNLQLFVMRVANHSHNATGHIEDSVFINPRILEASPERKEYTEGCLSFPRLYLPVERAASIDLEWFTVDGQKKQASFHELAAICAQHEMDHLKGVNFIDQIGKVKKAFALKKFQKLEKEALKHSKENKTGHNGHKQSATLLAKAS